MDPVSIAISIIFGVVSAAGTGLTAYFKVKSEAEKQIATAIDKAVSDSESKLELRVQAMEIKHRNLELSTVKKDEFAELRSDLRALIGRLDDFIRRAEKTQ